MSEVHNNPRAQISRGLFGVLSQVDKKRNKTNQGKEFMVIPLMENYSASNQIIGFISYLYVDLAGY